MLAAYYEQTGPAAQVLHLAEVPTPEPAAGEVRVRLQWSGVNPSDVKSRAGLRSKVLAFPRIIPHSDGMGVIDAVGAGVDASRTGQRVWVWNGAWGRPFGTAAQFITVPQAQAVALADGVSAEAAACFGIPAMTALHAVRCNGGVQGQDVLVTGGAGAVGHYAIQMAKLLGARRVISTVSSDAKAQVAREAGADITINYRTEDVLARVREATSGAGVGRIIDMDAGANGATDAEAVMPNGTVVIYGSSQPQVSFPFFALLAKNVALQFFIVYHLQPADRAAAQAQLDTWLRAGALKHNIAQRMPLADIVKAHELQESGALVGNLVLQVP
jgi:NADPH2:quinone reductase